MKYLVDANVLSEATPPRPVASVLAWLGRHEADVAVNPIILGEILYGILQLPAGTKRDRLHEWFAAGAAYLPVFDLDARGLLTTAARMRDAGELPSGKKIGGKADFFLGAADAPIDPAADWKPTSLQGKIEGGASFAQTQFCMDAGVLRRYTQRLKENGIKLHMIIGVVPFRSAKSANWIKDKLFGSIVPQSMIDRMENASDPIAEGKAILIDYLKEISEIPGVAGAHIMAPMNDDAVPEVIEKFRKGA